MQRTLTDVHSYADAKNVPVEHSSMRSYFGATCYAMSNAGRCIYPGWPPIPYRGMADDPRQWYGSRTSVQRATYMTVSPETHQVILEHHEIIQRKKKFKFFWFHSPSMFNARLEILNSVK